MVDIRAAYDELYVYTMGRPGFILQHVVDAFAVQTATADTKPIAIVFGLVGLYLHVEKQFSGKQVQKPVPRFKGLGEMDADELWETTMNPATRTVRRITIEDAERAEATLELLMGERVEPRKNWLIEAAGRIDQETIDA